MLIPPLLIALLAGPAQPKPFAPEPATTAPATTATHAEPTQAQGAGDGARRDFRVVWRDRPSIRAGRWLRLDIRGRIQVDSRHAGDDPDKFDPFQLQRARLGVDGELFRVVQFSIEREFSESELDANIDAFIQAPEKQWKDVWGELNLGNALQFRGGRFKIPFGLDQLTSVSNNDFVFRSLGGSYLSPARDTGAMAHGRFFGRALNYSFGVFQKDGDNSRSTKIAGGDLTFAGRVTARPLDRVKTANLDNAEFGVSYANTEVSDQSTLPNGLRGRTAVSRYTFFEPVFVRGTRQRIGADVEWNDGPFGARGEFIYVSDQRLGQGLRGDDLNDARARAWYVSGTWVVTGDDKDHPVEPRKPLFAGGIGAVEIAVRYERLWFDSEPTGEPAFSNSRAEVILPNGDRIVTLGVNWFLNRWMKLQFNALHESLQDPGRTPLPDGGTSFWSTVFRAQVAL